MKLEVGMYLRHSGLEGEYPIIQKIIKLETPGRCGGKYKVYTDKCEDWFIDSDYIELDKSKYSHNLIDLIEVGDYVNGSRVNGLPLYKHEHVFDESPNDLGLKHYRYTVGIPYTDDDIKSIVTKEQFKSNEYVVE